MIFGRIINWLYELFNNFNAKNKGFPESDVLAEAVFEIDDSKYSELQKKKLTNAADAR